jgi:hypothetical protein
MIQKQDINTAIPSSGHKSALLTSPKIGIGLMSIFIAIENG